MSGTVQYASYVERPEWIYDQALKIGEYVKTPDMVALKARSEAEVVQRAAKQFPEFYTHYTKTFFRIVYGRLNGPAFLMLLKQRKRMDEGKIAWVDGNQEVIGASFQLLLRKLSPELQASIMSTYKDLVDEEKEELRAAIEQKLRDQGEQKVEPEDIEQLLKTTLSAPQQVEELIDTETTTKSALE